MSQDVFSLLLCGFSLLLSHQGALSYEYRINSASDLIQFSNHVGSGASYSGTTVFLDADIDFSGGLSEQFEPIGKDTNNSFQGTFDGQGHTISNLAITSSSQYAGLFGYSEGATIRNVVLDSSCSVVSTYNSTHAYTGGIVGKCYASSLPCTIENCVNAASVAFTGNITTSLYIGGIAGYVEAADKEVVMRNCANYGSVTHSGIANYAAYIGGNCWVFFWKFVK